MKCGGAKMQSGGATKGGSNAKMGIFGIPNAGGTGPETMKKGGSKVTAVKHSCPPGTVRSATGGCVSQRPVPKAQMGAIVKAIGKGISTGAKVANKGIKAAKAEKFAKETAHLKRYEDWEKYNAAKPGKLVKKVVASAAGAGTGYVAGKAVINKKKK
jgi:hypothetical protein